VKLVKNVMDATVNDVLVAALTGSLRNYLLARGEATDGKEIRAMVPVNIRANDAGVELGNKFALVYLALPVGVADTLDRLFAVKRGMDAIKASPEALITYQILSGVGRTPGELATLISRYFASKASAVLTNVPGPQQRLYFAGKRFERMVFWVPQSGSIGMGLSIYSYAGEVTIGVITDEKRVPDPEKIVDGFVDEFNRLLALARLPEAEETAKRSQQKEQTGVQEIPIQSEQSPEEAIAELLGQLRTAQADPEPHRCTATTKSGTRCKNRHSEGSQFCHLHNPTKPVG
jgi:diacylglycerol O-acyltransferase